MHRAALSLVVTALFLSTARADDLTTRDGTVYKNYKVLGHDAGFITIMYADGGGKIPLSQLPDDLQKKYGYNAAAAATAAQAEAEQERKDRKAIQDEEAAHQQAKEAAAKANAPVVMPVVLAPTAPAASTPQAPSRAGVVVPAAAVRLPPDAMSWPDIEKMSAKFIELQMEISRLTISAGGEQQRPTDAVTLGALRQRQREINEKFRLQEQYLMDQAIPGMTLTPEQLQAKKSELAGLKAEVARVDPASGSMIENEWKIKMQRIKLLNLELKFANAPVVETHAARKNGLYTWDNAKSMTDRRVHLFDEVIQFNNSSVDHSVQVTADTDEDNKLAKEQQDFVGQLETHQVRGFKQSPADLKDLKEQIATVDAELTKLVQAKTGTPEEQRAIFADKQKLWFLKLKLEYANK